MAPLLAELDIADVAVVGTGDLDLGGSDVVVVTALDEAVAREIAVRSPDAVVIVASDSAGADCAALLEQTRFPRARVVGVASADGADAQTRADAVAQLVQAVLHDRSGPVECLVRGDDDVIAPVLAVLGTEGVRRISAPEAP